MACVATSVVFVKIGREGQSIKEFAVTSNTTYADIFRKAGLIMDTERETIHRNGIPQMTGIMSSFVCNNDVLIIKPKAFPRMITVKVSRVGSTISPILVSERSTVKQCLVSAGMLPFADEDVWLHENDTSKGYIVTMDQVMWSGYTLILEKRKPITLYNKIYHIIDNGPEIQDSNDLDTITSEICIMLYRDYNGIK